VKQRTRGARAARWLLALAGMALWALTLDVEASGTTPYLPLNLSPEIERQIERVLVLGGRPVMTRPVRVDTVLQALPKACKRDAALCRQVRRYLDRYFGAAGVTEGSIEVAGANHSTMTLPNERGERVDAAVDGSVGAFYRPADHLLLSAGAVGYAGTDGRLNPDGTMLSTGDEYLQVDVGYRDHWFSPLTDSSMLISTEAPTLPSITISNQRPIGLIGLDYEFFLARMDYSHDILWQGVDTAGYPRLAGMHLGITPLTGWSFAGNATWQFGGGGRPGSLSGFLDNLFKSTVINEGSNSPNLDSRFSNRAVSLTSAYTFPTRSPFEAYVEYAGRDTLHGEGYRFRETGLSAGLHFPEFLNRFDLTLEASEWQDAWYTDYVWLNGTTVNGYVIGNWGADWRTFSNDVGAQSEMASLGWPLRSGDTLYLRLRTLQNQHYEGESYTRADMLTVEYSQPRNGYTRGLELDVGRDSFDSNYARLAAFVRFDGGNTESADSSVNDEDEDSSQDADGDSVPETAGLERFVDLGISGGRLGLNLAGFSAAEEAAPLQYQSEISPHLGLGVRHAVTENGDLGVRAELDDFHGAMLALRVLDYRYRLNQHFAMGGFLGFARYSAPTPAQGYYYGIGMQWRDLFPHWDLSLDARFFDHMQRNKLLPSDPQNGDPVEWYEMQAPSLYLSRRF
jgi:hypothetical protein